MRDNQMKMLYAIQGTGNGHISRARDIIPALKKHGEVDVLVSGIQADVDLGFPIKFKLYGCSFIFGKKGGVSIWQTVKSLRVFQLIRDIRKVPVEQYDLVISDFEPISVWACKMKKKKVYALSHQCAVLHPKAAKPSLNDLLGKMVLKYYAKCDVEFGFYFERLSNHIFPPVIRKEIKDLSPISGNHYTVYLPSYSNKTIIEILSKVENTNWEVFSKHTQKTFRVQNVLVQPINNASYMESLKNSKGVLMGAGFEGPCEAIYLQKKLMVIPMSTQYEQHCNAAGLEQIGVPVIHALNEENIPKIQKWTKENHEITANFNGDIAQESVEALLKHYHLSQYPQGYHYHQKSH